MPNAMRPSAPRPQTFNAMRPTTAQVPRMMTSQRMRESPRLMLASAPVRSRSKPALQLAAIAVLGHMDGVG